MSEAQWWDEAMVEEIGWWRKVLMGGARENYDPVEAAKPRPFPARLAELLPGDPPWRVLDVGSGPVSVLGLDARVALTQADPLAAEYLELLQEIDLDPPGVLVAANGERLTETFGRKAFDMVYSHNALDHTENPLVMLRQMLEVVRPGCWVVAETYRNEGHGNRYHGLHRWNFDLVDGRAVLWNAAGERWDVRNEIECAEWVVDMRASLVGAGGPACVRMRGRRSG